MLVSYYTDYEIALRELQKQFPGIQIQGTFLEFMDARAREGVTIGRVGRGGDKGMNLGYVGSYIYWVVEIAVAAGVGLVMAKLPANTPFCTNCQAWKTEQSLGTLSVLKPVTLDILNQGDIHRFQDPHLTKDHPLIFKAFVCPHCGEEGTVEINVQGIAVNAKGEQKAADLGTWTYPGESLAAWHHLFFYLQMTPLPPQGQ
jgi:hypothetical protein